MNAAALTIDPNEFEHHINNVGVREKNTEQVSVSSSQPDNTFGELDEWVWIPKSEANQSARTNLSDKTLANTSELLNKQPEELTLPEIEALLKDYKRLLQLEAQYTKENKS